MENEKVEVPTKLLEKMFGFMQHPFLNAKEEDEKKEDDDEMEYKGEKYSKKELINCYKAKMNEMAKEADDKKAEEHEAKETKKEEKEEHEEKKNSISDEDMEFFNSMQNKINESAQNNPIHIWSEKQGEKEGHEQFRIRK